MDFLDFMSDPQLSGGAFDGDSWAAWRAVQAAADAQTLTVEQREHFDRLAGGREVPSQPVAEFVAVVGRRADKTQQLGARAVYEATVGAEVSGVLRRLSPGERGVFAVLAVDKQQAGVALGYVSGIVRNSPVLSRMVTRETATTVEFDNGASIEVMPNNFRAIRGRTLLGAALDEAAFFRSEESALPDVETYRALMPALATTGGRLFIFSSPYARRGLLYAKWRKHFGKSDDRVLVIQGGTRDLNPLVSQRIIDEALADDPEGARAEWLGQFRKDVESFISREAIEQCMELGRVELAYLSDYRYRAFVDPSGGSNDSMTLAIGHDEGDTVVVDAVRERRPPFSPDDVVRDFADVCREYRLRKVTGDRYGGEWPRERFGVHGISYDVSSRVKGDMYRDLLPVLNSGRIRLPENDRLAHQLVSLERRTGRGGKDSIDHQPGGHDDVANAVAGLVMAGKPRKRTGVLF